MKIKRSLLSMSLIFIGIIFLNCSGGDDSLAPNPSPLPTPSPGDRQITHLQIDGYEIDVYIPENYDESKIYPVIYFNDGQSLFQAGALELDTKINELVEKNLIQEVIVVGIYSDGNRVLDYTPYEDAWMAQNWNLTAPNADGYTQDIVNKIIPYIDQNYATIKDARGRAIMGYSLGGLHATWAGLRFADHFSMIAAFSPSYWAGNHAIFNENPSSNQNLKIWFDIGTGEWNYYVPFQRLLLSQGFDYGKDAFYYEVNGGTHDFFSWQSRIEYPLLAFFGTDNNFNLTDMTIHTQVIPSQSRPGVYFLRINPVVTTINGIQYSLAEAATYTLQNPNAGTILSDGRFSFSDNKDLIVTVSYKGLIREHTISYNLVKSLTGG